MEYQQETEFSRDSVFSYHHSYLPDYVAEKTQGKIPGTAVERFLLEDIRNGSLSRLKNLTENTCVAVDGETQEDLDNFAADVLATAREGKRFLFRSAASILTSLAKLGKQPVVPDDMGRYKKTANPGVVLVGSHVQKTTQQLEQLLTAPGVMGIKVDVLRLREKPNQRDILLEEILQKLYRTYQDNKTSVVYTSREELTFHNIQERLDFGGIVSSFLMEVVKGLPEGISFLISKGGITSNDVLSKGLGLKSVGLLGQILPGCSIVRTPKDHPQFPDLPVVLFPGNVGDVEGLLTVYHRLM